ncbi:beta-ketoacyl-[acyl-carrier-protein] synthase family protein [Fluviicola taffensis]|uniref:Beta-ketoacyl-acyl-carrier-protein synthase II n=1 Tax=Fluviicola taffensis (strain DSM 16823 / NCIMB 13979 / RW262) TaxID=755732 RepID=F2IEB0_FLUTR|nr:beta-ketoacyl-[acyl-carrier-protein] synthase family protein [Fluviicola taffensis]AEA43434.1 Beta-ketoacyl-acyl-carrier-protein synthase II [Fluviicola taffensis DSM 16823]
MRIYVTGYGVISSIGENVEESLLALRSEKTGIKQGEKTYTERFKVGEIRWTNDELVKRFELTQDASRTALLGMIAAKEAFKGHQLSPEVRTGLISGTSVGGMDVSELAYKDFLNGEQDDLNIYRNHPSGTTSEQIAGELGVNGYVNTISTACSSAANSIMLGARMLRSGQLDRVIVGGTDGLSQFTISGFRSLMIFDDEWCRPFDESRKGLNLGEGAGYLVLETEETIKKTGKTPLAVLSGWCNASDAYHQTASSPEGLGATLSMKGALEIAGLHPSDIDYINAHGTATPNNDLSESEGIKAVFGTTIPPFSSTKAYTGHTLAASGGIEAVFAILALQKGILLPNLNFRNPIEETQLIPVKSYSEGNTINHILSNSFGFGGNNSTIILSKVS